MESILSELQRLITATVLVKPEQAIFRVLNTINESVLQNSDENSISKLNSSLSSLIKLNKGSISPQSAILIGTKQALLFNFSKNLSTDAFVSGITSKSMPAQIIEFGVLARNSLFNENQLQKVVQQLLKVQEKSFFAAFYTIRAILKALKNSLPELDATIFNFMKKCFSSQNIDETTRIAGLKLASSLAKRRNLQTNQLFSFLDQNNTKTQPDFVRDEVQKVAANIAASFIISSPGSPSFDSVKDVFNHFHEQATFNYFSTIVGPVLMSKYSIQLLRIFKDSFAAGIPSITPFCTNDVKYQLFSELITQQPSSVLLEVLGTFPQTQEVIIKTANFALKLYESENLYDKESSSQYFSSFARDHREETYNFICMWIDKLNRGDCEEEDWISAGSIISKLLASSQDKEMIISQFAQQIVHIQTQGLNSRSVFSGSFIAAFFILSVLPEQLIDQNLVRNAMKRVIENVISNSEESMNTLFAAVLQFYLFHPTFDNVKEIAQYALQHISTLTSPSVNSLVSLLPKIFDKDEKIVGIIKSVLDYTLTLKPTSSVVAAIAKKIEPEEIEVIEKIHSIPKHNYDYTKKVTKLILAIPKLILAAPAEAQKEIILGLHGQQPYSAIQNLILKAIIDNEKTELHLPRGFLIPLLKTLKGSDKIYLQSTCETVASYLVRKETFIKATVKFIETNKSKASLYLLCALVNNVHLSNDFLVRLILCANERTTMPTLRSTALFAMSSIILSHQMDIASLCLGAHQLTILFDILHLDQLPSPMTSHLVSETLNVLLPTLVPDALEPQSPLKPAILSVIETLMATPMQLAREDYFRCLNTICAYAFQYMDSLQLKYSSMKSPSVSIRLLALSTYSQYITHMFCNAQLFSYTKLAMQLLHETGSQYAKDFILAIAASLTCDQQHNELYEMCQLLNIVLAGRCVPELSGVFPSNELIDTALKASVQIFSKLIVAKPLQLSLINTILSNICISTTSDDYNSRVSAFAALGSVYEMIKAGKNKKLLDHYFNNLLTAAKIGFASGVQSSSKFLYEFVQDKDECLGLYTRQLQKMQIASIEAYQVAARFCRIIASKKETEAYKAAMKNIFPAFTGIIKQAMSITINSKEQLQPFREYVSSYYEDLAASYFFLLKELGENIDKKAILSFFIVELRTANDVWQVKAAVSAITSYSKLFPDEDVDIIEEGLEMICTLIPQLGLSISKELSLLVTALTAMKELTEEMWEIIVYIVLNCPCKPIVYLRIVDHFTNEKFETFAAEMIVAALNCFVEGTFNIEEIEAIYVLMMEKGSQQEISRAAVNWCEQTGRIKLGFKLAEIAITKFKDFDMEMIAKFASANVRNGGIQFYINSGESEVELLARGGANAVFGFSLGDSQNASTYVSLLSDALEKSDHKMDEPVLKLCINCVANWANDKETASKFAKLLLKVKENMNEQFNEAWDKLPQQEKETCIKVLETITC